MTAGNKAVKSENRLPRNFHSTFAPERRYISEMLRFAAGGNSGDYQEIAQMTGIPTGKSSGKVQPTLDYCRGMGLITLDPRTRTAVKSPELTPFGRIVLLEDLRMSDALTQWIAHFNLCRRNMGADAWYHVFMRGRHTLGMQFERQQLNNYLVDIYGTAARNLIGPMIRMYQEDASFRRVGVLLDTDNTIERVPAPVAAEYANAYAAWMLSLMEAHFPKTVQVTVTELDRVCGWQSIPGWSDAQAQKVLSLIEAKGPIGVDRQMQPWIVRRAGVSEHWWTRLYEDLI